MVPAIIGRAESLPLDDASVDASMATLTVHQWRDWESGIRELVRVTREAIVVMTFDGELLHRFWLGEYSPETMEADKRRLVPMDDLRRALSVSGRRVEVRPVPIPIDCLDGFTEAYYARPEMLLNDEVTAAQSVWKFIDPAAFVRFQQSLRTDLESGAWDARHGAWRTKLTFEGSLRLVVSTPA